MRQSSEITVLARADSPFMGFCPEMGSLSREVSMLPPRAAVPAGVDMLRPLLWFSLYTCTYILTQ